jgi:hypothetical protein
MTRTPESHPFSRWATCTPPTNAAAAKPVGNLPTTHERSGREAGGHVERDEAEAE